jgi:glycosyltransferase involved in cell wall biosynthesis
LNNLSGCTESIRRAGARRILLIPFEDGTLRARIESRLDHCAIDVWTKSDLAGLSLRQLIKRIRSHRWDAVVLSLYQSTARRSRSSAELLLAGVNAPLRWLRLDEEHCRRISPYALLCLLLPRVFAACVLGLTAVASQYAFLLMMTKRRRTPKTPLPESLQGAAMLFLRTDLAGPLKAGGSISHVQGMAQAFLRAGFRVIFVADAFIESLPPAIIQRPLPPIDLLDVLDEFQLIAYNFQVIRHLKRIAGEFPFVLIYQRHGIFNIAGGAFARRLRIPFVLEANASEVWVKKNWSRLLFEDLARRSESCALGLADRVAVISRGVEEQLASYGLEESRVILNPNGVDPEEFSPSIDGTGIRKALGLQSRLIVGFIGTFTRWHGVETLFDAAVQVVGQNAQISFLLIGDGDLRSTLKRRAEELHLSDRLIFTGLVPHSEAPRYLAACDILVSPHLGFEGGQKFFGSPTKLFEYMAMGKAIIASKLDQIGEIVADCANGLLMEPGNVDQLRDNIITLANDKQLRARLGAQARTDVIREYSWKCNVERIMNSLR